MFVADLRRASGGSVSPPTRSAVTVVLNALRCGTTFEYLITLLPALEAGVLLGAYLELQGHLDASRASWSALVTAPSATTLAEHAAAAELVLPVPVHRVQLAIAHLEGSVRLPEAVAAVTGEVERVTRETITLEQRLTRFPAGDHRATQLGRSLHDVAQPGLWTHPYFLPTRVGELSTTRVRDLRGEERL